MDPIIERLTDPGWMTDDWAEQVWQLILVLIAGVLGGLIGLEREIANKPAGLRTHMFVAASAAMFMLLGDAVIDLFARHNPGVEIQPDPIRMMQAIVVGISFLGAGTIVHSAGAHVEGLTTAASILLTAGVGMAVAAEQLVLASGVSIIALAVLYLVGLVELRFGRNEPPPPADAAAKAGAPSSEAPTGKRPSAGASS